jgi:probable HAF family extracellular repeat protein
MCRRAHEDHFEALKRFGESRSNSMRISLSLQYALSIGATIVMLTGCNGTTNVTPAQGNGLSSNSPVKAGGAIPKAYVLTDLGTGLPGSPGLVPAAINNHGVVVGEASALILGQLSSCSPSTCGPPEGWIFRAGALSEIPPLSGDSYSAADDVNSAGMVVGGSATNYTEDAVLWGTDGSPTNLGPGLLGSQSSAEATAINDSTKIVGVSYDSTDEIPTGFHLDGKTTAPCGKSTEGAPSAINNAGLLIGTSFLGSGGAAAIECPPLVTIEAPPPSNPSWVNYGLGINDRGQAVGRLAIGPGAEFHPFLYYKGNTTDLGTLFPRKRNSVAFAFSINQSGVIAGWSAAAPGSPPTRLEAFVYADGQMVDLNKLLPASVRKNWTLVVATSINDRKQIVGSAFVGGYPNGVEHGFLLTPKGMGRSVVSKARFVPGNTPTVRPTRAQWASMEALRAKRLRLQR